MAVERAAGGTNLIDVLERVLDKGIVIQLCSPGIPDVGTDAWIRSTLMDINLGVFGSRVTVKSIEIGKPPAVTPLAPADRTATHGGAAPKPTLRRSDDEDDDDDGGNGNSGSSGAPALVYVQIEPRRPHPARPRRTRDG